VRNLARTVGRTDDDIYCTGSGATTACGGLVPAVAGVTDRIVLDRTVVPAGTTVHGSVVVVNRTGHAVALLDPHGCRPSMGVAVTSATIAPGAAFSTECIGQPLVLGTGTTRYPVDVITTYPGCVPAASGDASSATPACLPGGGPPDLPAGSYHAVLVGLELALPQATAPVRLTPRR
jgi:hypothetical protein